MITRRFASPLFKTAGVAPLALSVMMFGLAGATLDASAQDFRYHRSVTLKVGQSIVLKGVRNSNCGTRAPSWSSLARQLPSTSLGSFSDGGAGTVQSDFCKKRFKIKSVAARGVRFTAKQRGKQKLTIFRDPVSITVR